MIKKILFGVALLFAVVLIYGAFKPGAFAVQRTIAIQATPEKIFPLINDYHNWPAWSPWEKLDPNMKRTLTGPLSGTGAAPLVGLGDDAQLYVQNPIYDNIFGWINNNGRLNFTDVNTGARVPMTCLTASTWRRFSESCSASVAAPSSAHRGSGRRKWHAKIVWLISWGRTESRMRSSEP